MRALLFSMALLGCGPVHLGDEPEMATFQPDADTNSRLDASLAPDGASDAAVANARHGDGGPGWPVICLQNESFEGMPAFNSGVPDMFDALPWTSCVNPAMSMANTPDIGNDTIQQIVATVPKATDGATFLGMQEDEQASQHMCRSVAGGTSLSFTIDLCRINLGEGVVPTTEAAYLEIWGGVAADCSQRELLWASEPLAVPWKTYCVTIRPQQFMDSLTLRSRSDQSLAALTYIAVDHIVPVESCP